MKRYTILFVAALNLNYSEASDARSFTIEKRMIKVLSDSELKKIMDYTSDGRLIVIEKDSFLEFQNMHEVLPSLYSSLSDKGIIFEEHTTVEGGKTGGGGCHSID